MEITQIIKKNLNFESLCFRYALRLSIACFIAQLFVFIWQLQNGYWVILTIVVCMLHTIGRTIKRSFQRMLGIFIGALVAVYLAAHLGRHFHYTEALIFVLLFFAYYSRAFDYGLSTVFLTPAVILFIQVIGRGDWNISWLHFSATILASLLVVGFSFLMLPSYSSKMIQDRFNGEWLRLQRFLDNFIRKLGEEKPDSALSENDISDRLSALYFVVKETEIESFLHRKAVRDRRDSYFFISKVSGYLEIILADISFEELAPKKDKYLEDVRQGLIAFHEMMSEISYHNNGFYLSVQGKEQYEVLVKRLTAYIDVVYRERITAFNRRELGLASSADLIRVHIALEHLLEATHCFEKLKMV